MHTNNRPMQRNVGNNRNREQSRTIHITNLNKLTRAQTLLEYFDRFQKVEDATLGMDDNDKLLGDATVVFRRPPANPEKVSGNHRIDGRQVKVEFVRNQENEYHGMQHAPRLFARSFSMGSMRTPKEFIEEWTCRNNIRFILQYDMRRINIFFSHLDEEYKVEYNFKDVMGDMFVERDRRTIFTIPLRYPGTFWRRNCDVLSETKNSFKRGRQWERVTLIPLTPDADTTTRLKSPILPIPRPDVLNIGSWIVYRLEFDPAPKFKREFEEKMQEAADFNLVPRNLDNHKPFIEVVKASTLPKPFGHVERCALNLEFDVLYMLESVISYYYFNEYNLDVHFYEMIKELDPKVACGILQLISSAKQRVWNPLSEFDKIFERMGMKVSEQRNIPSHCALLRKVIITPSQIYVQPPTLETTNRVVRHYKDQSDEFIRVQFMDEGFNRVGAGHANRTKDSIYNRIYDVLKRGIQIGKKRYEFLAFSSSQLREQGCWFFAPTKELTANDIRQWMGVFSHEKVVAKHAIRMGQCFSSTRPVHTLQKDEVEYIDDVVHNGFTFSDGVGKISPSLAEEVALRLELKSVPSAFQFRLGGAKGVLTVEKKLLGTNIKVQLRPSQIKFESEHLTLEVIRTSTYIHGYLNRQVITLLSALGVKDEVFMTLMNEMVQDVNKLFQKSEEAIRVLLGNVDEAGTALFMVPIIQAGFLERNDPYIKNLLNLFRISVLKDLKKKAKIIVPKGAYLLGVMDETETLEEGEVFIQICETSNNGIHRQIITGDVVVFRNPCFHPGDVRTVKAVDREELHYLVDVVVFSSKGYRDIPSMCSGGDLDGDDYTVYWDERLLPPRGNFPPMNYTAAPAKMVDEVKILDIIRFFVNYMNNDNLGQIANAHLATADQSLTGARDGKCILLAQLHSEAVDFPKSGKPALLTNDLKVKVFPDFMQKKDRESYQSKKVLGHIFRAIDQSDYKDYKSTLTAEANYDIRLRVPDMELYIAEARELRTEYNRNLYAHMNQYGVQTEAEICSGYIIKWLKKGRSKSRYEQHDYTMKAIKSFKTLWKKKFEQEFLDSNKKVDLSKRQLIEAKAAAWYYVTYHPNERGRDMSVEGGFFSFPWIVYEYICDIAARSKIGLNDTIEHLDLLAPIPEENIKEGVLRLAAIRDTYESLVVANSDSEESSDDDSSTEYSSSEDEEVYTTTNRNAIYAPSVAAIRNNNNNSIHPSSIPNPIGQRPLEPHQSVVPADATDEELFEALIGN